MTTTPQAQVAEAAQVREKFLFEPERVIYQLLQFVQ